MEEYNAIYERAEKKILEDLRENYKVPEKIFNLGVAYAEYVSEYETGGFPLRRRSAYEILKEILEDSCHQDFYSALQDNCDAHIDNCDYISAYVSELIPLLGIIKQMSDMIHSNNKTFIKSFDWEKFETCL